MKNLFIFLACVAIILSSCDKQDDDRLSNRNSTKDQIIDDANELSKNHDLMVNQMLNASKDLMRQKSKGLVSSESASMELTELFDVIASVTGVKPFIVKDFDSSKQFVKAGVNSDNLPIFNFDQDEINLQQYVTSPVIKVYIDLVDQIVQDSISNIAQRIAAIQQIQDQMKNETDIDPADFANFMNTTEVLKGSLVLWSDQFSNSEFMPSSIGMMKAKSMTKWSFFAKLGFVAAADAVGAVAGTFLGGYIIVSGVPIYIPAGPSGACAGLATLSIIAATMVGW